MISSSDRERFLRDGYLVIPGVVPENLCQDVIYTILNYLDVDLDDPASWSKEEYAVQGSGPDIVPLHHSQSLWNIRQHPAVYEIFSDLYQDKKLWVSMDKVSYKPPVSETTRRWRQTPIHWDCNPWKFNTLSIQGLVYLTDTEASQGAFCCVPSIYKNLKTYLDNHRGDELARYPRVADADVVPVPGPAGSLVLFHRLMPHTNLKNESSAHGFMQYVSMDPEGGEEARAQRVRQWQKNVPPDGVIAHKARGQQVSGSPDAAALTLLGRKLVGVDRW